jgi:hypothetical protein
MRRMRGTRTRTHEARLSSSGAASECVTVMVK